MASPARSAEVRPRTDVRRVSTKRGPMLLVGAAVVREVCATVNTGDVQPQPTRRGGEQPGAG
jgi:hypothetical protein